MDVWDKYVEGRPMVRFHMKLKQLKEKLREWNKRSFGHLSQGDKQMEDAMMCAEHAYDLDPTKENIRKMF